MKLTKLNSVRIVLGVVSIALSFAWGKFIGVGPVVFPTLDYWDVGLGVFIGVFLFYEAVKNVKV